MTTLEMTNRICEAREFFVSHFGPDGWAKRVAEVKPIILAQMKCPADDVLPAAIAVGKRADELGLDPLMVLAVAVEMIKEQTKCN